MDPPSDPRVEKGRAFAEYIWWSLAKRIFRIASEHYQWTDEQMKSMSELFLRGNDYKVEVKY